MSVRGEDDGEEERRPRSAGAWLRRGGEGEEKPPADRATPGTSSRETMSAHPSASNEVRASAAAAGAASLVAPSPLRILVLGDSLAFGLGQSHSAAPILPQSLSKSLSRHFDGRPVLWTCHGKPGLSAAQLLREIDVFADEQAQEGRAIDSPAVVKSGVYVENKDVDARERREWREWRRALISSHGQRADPESFGDYDIVVVIIGMGDLKGAALPFLKVNDADNHGEQPSAGTFHGDLERVIFKLKERGLLRQRDRSGSAGEDSNGRGSQSFSQSLVVFPALPARPVHIFSQPPLSWFIHPLVEMIDNDKQQLADHFRDFVVFSPCPSEKDFSDFESSIGKLSEEVTSEKVVVSMKDIFKNERDELEGKMREHWLGKGNDLDVTTLRVQNNDVSYRSEIESIMDCGLSQIFPLGPGSTLVAADGIHPDDKGYDFWGRHISGTIKKKWEDAENQCSMAENTDREDGKFR